MNYIQFYKKVWWKHGFHSNNSNHSSEIWNNEMFSIWLESSSLFFFYFPCFLWLIFLDGALSITGASLQGTSWEKRKILTWNGFVVHNHQGNAACLPCSIICDSRPSARSSRWTRILNQKLLLVFLMSSYHKTSKNVILSRFYETFCHFEKKGRTKCGYF